jgi:hypothetical protein
MSGALLGVGRGYEREAARTGVVGKAYKGLHSHIQIPRWNGTSSPRFVVRGLFEKG